MKRTFPSRPALIAFSLVVLGVFVAAPWNDEYFGGWIGRLLREWILLSAAAGSAFVLIKALAWRTRTSVGRTRAPEMLPKIPYWTSVPWRPRPPAQILMEMPNFGLYCGWILSILMFIFMVDRTPRAPTGLMVHLPSRYVAALPRAPQSESLGVYVDTGGRFYVNGEVVSRDQLRARLQAELGRRSLWIVYIEANDDIEFRQAVYAIDTIQGLGARVYWVTRRVREELNKTGDR